MLGQVPKAQQWKKKHVQLSCSYSNTDGDLSAIFTSWGNIAFFLDLPENLSVPYEKRTTLDPCSKFYEFFYEFYTRPEELHQLEQSESEENTVKANLDQFNNDKFIYQ